MTAKSLTQEPTSLHTGKRANVSAKFKVPAPAEQYNMPDFYLCQVQQPATYKENWLFSDSTSLFVN